MRGSPRFLDAHAHGLEVDLPRAAAAMRAPHGDCQREDEIVVFAGPGVEGEVSYWGELDPELLQLAHQRLGFRQLFLDLEPAFVQHSRETSVSFGTAQIAPSQVSAVPAVINTPSGEIPA